MAYILTPNSQKQTSSLGASKHIAFEISEKLAPWVTHLILFATIITRDYV